MPLTLAQAGTLVLRHQPRIIYIRQQFYQLTVSKICVGSP